MMYKYMWVNDLYLFELTDYDDLVDDCGDNSTCCDEVLN